MKKSSSAVSSVATHPQGLTILFLSEMWERFSFYGMRALLVLYMTKRLIYSDESAYGIYAAYGALVYASPVLGGMIADRILGARRAILLGGTLMAFGHFFMAIEDKFFFFLALALIATGNGFFKANISSMVGKLYRDGDPLRDSGYTIFYMGINIGAAAASLACGYVGETLGWHYGFGMAGVGMVLGLGVFTYGQKILGDHGLPPVPGAAMSTKAGVQTRKTSADVPWLSQNHLAVFAGTLILIPLVALGISNNEYVQNLLNIVGLVTISYLLVCAFKEGREARDRLILVILLMFFHTTFWALFEQAGSSLTTFADRIIDRSIFGWEMPASMAQAFNPLFIILLGPFFVAMWRHLFAIKKSPSIPVKFAIGILGVGLGFYALDFGLKLNSPNGDPALLTEGIGLEWLVLTYFLHTAAELFISPIGLSAVSKLSPAKLASTVMGAWFLSISFGHHIAGLIAILTGVQQEEGVAVNEIPVGQLASIYSDVYFKIFIGATLIGVFLLLINPFLKRMQHGVK
jgi:POT family proton-dependent oligopeptide transporter